MQGFGGGEGFGELTSESGNCTLRSPTTTEGGMSDRSWYTLPDLPTSTVLAAFEEPARDCCAPLLRLSLPVAPRLLMRFKKRLVLLPASLEPGLSSFKEPAETLELVICIGGAGKSSAEGVMGDMACL